MSYTLEQLKSMGAKPLTQNTQNESAGGKTYSFDELKAIGAKPFSNDEKQPESQKSFKYDVPEPTKEEKLSKINQDIQKAKEEEKQANSITGFLKNFATAKPMEGLPFVGGALALAKTANKAIDNPFDRNAESIKTLTDSLFKLSKKINEMDKVGGDTTKLKKIYNDQSTEINRLKGEIDTANKELPTTGEVVGQSVHTLLDALTLGVYGKATKGMVSGELAPKISTLPTVVEQVGDLLKKGRSYKQIATDLLKTGTEGLGVGYGYDVATGLEDKEKDPYTPGAITALGVGVPLGIKGAMAGENLIKGGFTNVIRTYRAFNPNEKAINQEVEGLRQSWQDFFNRKKSTTKTDITAKSYGKDNAEILAKNGYVPDIIKGDTLNTERISAQNRQDIINTSEAVQKHLDNLSKVAPETTKTPVSEFGESIIREIRNNPEFKQTGTVGSVEKEAQRRIADYMQSYPNGIPLGEMNRIRTEMNMNTNAFNKPQFEQDVENVIGDVVRKIIDQKSGSEAVRNINSQLGELMSIDKIINPKSSKTINGDKVNYGKMSRYFARVIGSMVGASTQLPFGIGNIIGAIGGDAFVRMINENSFAGPIRTAILSELKANPKIIEQFSKELSENQINALKNELNRIPLLPEPTNKDLRVKLESGKLIELPKESQSSFDKRQVEEVQNLLKNGAYRSNIADATKTPKITNNIAIPETVPQNKGMSSEYEPYVSPEKLPVIDVGPTPKKQTGVKVSPVIEKDGMYSSPEIGTVDKKMLIDGIRIAQESGIPVSYKTLPKGQVLQTLFKPDGSVEFVVSKNLENQISKTFTEKVKDIFSNGSLGLSTKDVSKNLKKNPLSNQALEFKGFTDITTKVLDKLKGRSTVSKQFISDLTNSPDLKQTERDIIRQVLETQGEKVNVTEFADKVKTELLPLTIKADKPYRTSDGELIYQGGRYESISLPDDLKGNVANYSERIYESPIKTSAGDTHFDGQSKNYFGHTRIEDMAGIKTRRVIEVQSDLYQKGNLEREGANIIQNKKNLKIGEKINQNGVEFYVTNKIGDKYYGTNAERLEGYADYLDNPTTKQLIDEMHFQREGIRGKKQSSVEVLLKLGDDAEVRNKELAKLQQYNDPTAHFRMVREEIKQASIDGKTKLQFPTGETAMKIEGLGTPNTLWRTKNNESILKPEDLKVGEEINQGGYYNKWIITDVLGDGKFKAVQKNIYDNLYDTSKIKGNALSSAKDIINNRKKAIEQSKETFDISGKIDTENPIYRFYEKTLGRYLTSKYGAKIVTDNKGVKWYEVSIKPEMAKNPVEAFGAFAIPITAGIKGLLSGKKPSDNVKDIVPQIKTEEKKQTPQEVFKKGKENIDFDEMKRQVAYRESRGYSNPYTAVNKNVDKDTGEITYDYGKYQVNEKTLATYGKRFLGKKVTVEEFKNSPELQEKFFEKGYKHLYNIGTRNYATFLAFWHKGWGDISRERVNRIIKENQDYINSNAPQK